LYRFKKSLFIQFLSYIGWDVALTTQGCMVMEGSLYWNPGASSEVANHLPFSRTNYPVYFEDWIGDKIDNRSDFSDSYF
jgi:hypothetical protein